MSRAAAIPFLRPVRSYLGPLFASLGFREESPVDRSNLTVSWSSSAQSVGRVTVLRWPKANHARLVGNHFTVELSSIRGNAAASERIYFLLSPRQLAEMERVHQTVVAALPSLTSITGITSFERFELHHQARSLLRPFNPLHERWFHYFGPEDILRWADFLACHFVDILARLEESTPHSSGGSPNPSLQRTPPG